MVASRAQMQTGGTAMVAELLSDMAALAERQEWDQVEDITSKVRHALLQVPEQERRDALLKARRTLERIRELINELAAATPEPNPIASPLMTGRWKAEFASFGIGQRLRLRRLRRVTESRAGVDAGINDHIGRICQLQCVGERLIFLLALGQGRFQWFAGNDRGRGCDDRRVRSR